LLIFFLNLSIRMRLDRYDGVGDIVWADGPVVQSTLDGVMDGLALIIASGIICRFVPKRICMS
jgi:hypothetical protein